MKNLYVIAVLLFTLSIGAQNSNSGAKNHAFRAEQTGVVDKKTGDVKFTDVCTVNVFNLTISEDNTKMLIVMSLLNELLYLELEAKIIKFGKFGTSTFYTVYAKEFGPMSILIFNEEGKKDYMISYDSEKTSDGGILFNKRFRSYKD